MLSPGSQLREGHLDVPALDSLRYAHRNPSVLGLYRRLTAAEAGLVEGYTERPNRRNWDYECRAVAISRLTLAGQEFLKEVPAVKTVRKAARNDRSREDRRILEAWETKRYTTQAELAAALGKGTESVRLAIDRARKARGKR